MGGVLDVRSIIMLLEVSEYLRIIDELGVADVVGAD